MASYGDNSRLINDLQTPRASLPFHTHHYFPCAMALRLMPCSPRRRIRLVTVVSGLMARRSPVGPDMPPRTWRQQQASGPHGFAVREMRLRQRFRRTSPSKRLAQAKPAPSSCALLFTHGSRPVNTLRADAVASTTSHPAFVTIAIRPSWGMRWRKLIKVICPTEPAKCFSRGDWTTQITLKSLRK
jgi:hypothetical protein